MVALETLRSIVDSPVSIEMAVFQFIFVNAVQLLSAVVAVLFGGYFSGRCRRRR